MSQVAQPRQLTFRAVVLAIVLAVVLSAANAYLGLFAGADHCHRYSGGGCLDGRAAPARRWVDPARTTSSRPARRPVRRSRRGVIFTIPALVIMGY